MARRVKPVPAFSVDEPTPFYRSGDDHAHTRGHAWPVTMTHFQATCRLRILKASSQSALFADVILARPDDGAAIPKCRVCLRYTA